MALVVKERWPFGLAVVSGGVGVKISRLISTVNK
jgi:hypothetical protein